jgi:hypothetical protein
MESSGRDMTSLRRPMSVCDIGKDYLALHHIFGTDITRKDNISLIDNSTIIYANGNCVVIENIWNQTKQYIFSIDEGGIGCVAVHPSRFKMIL